MPGYATMQHCRAKRT